MYDVSPIKKNGEFHWFSMIFHISSVWFGVFFWFCNCELTDPAFGSSISELAGRGCIMSSAFRFSKRFFFRWSFPPFLAQNAHTFQVMVVFLLSNSLCKIDRRVVFFHPKRLICNKSIHVTTLNVDVSIPHGWFAHHGWTVGSPRRTEFKKGTVSSPKSTNGSTVPTWRNSWLDPKGRKEKMTVWSNLLLLSVINWFVDVCCCVTTLCFWFLLHLQGT